MLPDYVRQIILTLEGAGYQAYVVGGCVRDLLLGHKIQDWDITTNARPEQMTALWPDSKYENVFGTVILPCKLADGSTEAVVEITTFRSEQGYSDRRHPDEIRFEDEITADLARRDFTINALAMRPATGQPLPEAVKMEWGGEQFEVLDLFGGLKDLDKKILRGVGEPTDRFKEDALRMLRALRLATKLSFQIEPKTWRGIERLAGNIKFVANERIRDELIKICQTDKPEQGWRWLYESKLLHYIVPEMEEGVGMDQAGHHVSTVFEHNLLSLKHCPSPDWRVRLAALWHDIGKPRSRNFTNGKPTFYNHELIGARMVERIMTRLRFASEDLLKVVGLVRNHMFYYNVDEVTAASVRRLIAKVGVEQLDDLILLRVADRLGSGTPKAKPYKLRHLEYMFERVRHDPVSVKMLKINGDILLAELNLTPGPLIGAILDVLLGEVLEEPERNSQDYLLNRAKILSNESLAELRTRAKAVIAEKRVADDQAMKKDFHV